MLIRSGIKGSKKLTEETEFKGTSAAFAVTSESHYCLLTSQTTHVADMSMHSEIF